MKKALYHNGEFVKLKTFAEGESVVGLQAGYEWLPVVEDTPPPHDPRTERLVRVEGRDGGEHLIWWNLEDAPADQVKAAISGHADALRESHFAPRTQRALIAEYTKLVAAKPTPGAQPEDDLVLPASYRARAAWLASVWEWFQGVDARENALIAAAEAGEDLDIDAGWPTAPAAWEGGA